MDVRRYADGTVLRYDRAAHRLTADVQGNRGYLHGQG